MTSATVTTASTTTATMTTITTVTVTMTSSVVTPTMAVTTRGVTGQVSGLVTADTVLVEVYFGAGRLSQSTLTAASHNPQQQHNTQQ